MNRIHLVLSVVLFLFFSSCSVSSKNYNPDKKYPKEKLQQDYTLLKNILETKHPSIYWYTSKDSMDFYFDKYYKQIEDSMTELRFGWRILAPLTEKLHCGHTSFGMSKAYNKWVDNKIFPSFPLFMKIWGDTMVLSGNLNHKDSVLKRGMIITSINGIKPPELINTMFGYMTEDGISNNINYIRLSTNFPYYHRVVYGLRRQYDVTYKDSTGAEKSIRLPLYEPTIDTSKKNKSAPARQLSRAERKKRNRENDHALAIDIVNNTALITLNSFSGNTLRGFFRRSFKRIKNDNINNVVLDIRSNGGGKINLSTLLTKYVTRKPFRIADSATVAAGSLKPYTKYIKGKFWNNLALLFLTKKKSDGRRHFGYWEHKTFYAKKTNHFGGDLYILTNGPTFSASTLLCNDLKGQPGITLVGEEAGGGWHGNNGVMIPDITLPNTHLRVRLPLVRLVQFNHVPKDGHGVMPDIYVPPNYDALMKGVDKKMEVVMELIKKKTVDR
ncbi:MAG: S41 family peptidase [Ferruginibacter sp.]